MKNAIVYRQPKILPLPGAITPAMQRDATLPVKIEHARRAIAACEDLSELLRYRDQAEGLAAAVKVMKQVAPEMVHSANCLVADAWRKGGELLSQYSNVSKAIGAKPRDAAGVVKRGGTLPSERGRVMRELGITPFESSHMVRIAKAPREKVYENVQKYSGMANVVRGLPIVDTCAGRYRGVVAQAARRKQSDSFRTVMGTGGAMGISSALAHVRHVDLALVRSLAPDEKKLIRAKVAEIMELLDAIDEAAK